MENAKKDYQDSKIFEGITLAQSIYMDKSPERKIVYDYKKGMATQRYEMPEDLN